MPVSLVENNERGEDNNNSPPLLEIDRLSRTIECTNNSTAEKKHRLKVMREEAGACVCCVCMCCVLCVVCVLFLLLLLFRHFFLISHIQ